MCAVSLGHLPFFVSLNSFVSCFAIPRVRLTLFGAFFLFLRSDLQFPDGTLLFFLAELHHHSSEVTETLKEEEKRLERP